MYIFENIKEICYYLCTDKKDKGSPIINMSWYLSLGSQSTGGIVKPGSRWPLLSAMPTFPAAQYHRVFASTKLHCMVWTTCISHYMTVNQLGQQPVISSWSWVRCHNHYITLPNWYISAKNTELRLLLRNSSYNTHYKKVTKPAVQTSNSSTHCLHSAYTVQANGYEIYILTETLPYPKM